MLLRQGYYSLWGLESSKRLRILRMAGHPPGQNENFLAFVVFAESKMLSIMHLSTPPAGGGLQKACLLVSTEMLSIVAALVACLHHRVPLFLSRPSGFSGVVRLLRGSKQIRHVIGPEMLPLTRRRPLTPYLPPYRPSTPRRRLEYARSSCLRRLY
jgi:hypothetical protein